MPDNRTQITLGTTDRSTAVVGRVQKQYEQLERTGVQAAGRMNSAFERFRQNWLGITASIAGAMVTVRKAWDIARTAAQYEENVDRMTRSMEHFNVTGDQLIDEMKRVTSGQLSMAQSAQLASQGLAAGLDPTAIVQFTKLADVAADVTGRRLPMAFDQLVKAAATGEGEILKQLGIYTELTIEAQRVAEATGRTTAEISQQERALIGLNKILEQSDDILERFGVRQATAADRMRAFEATIEDVQLTVGRASLILGGLTLQGLQRVEPFQSLIQGLRLLNEQFKDTTQEMNQAERGLGNYIVSSITSAEVSREVGNALTVEKLRMKELEGAIDPTIDTLKKLTTEQAKLNDQLKKLREERTAIIEESTVRARELFPEDLALGARDVQDQIATLRQRFEELAQGAEGSAGKIREDFIREMDELLPVMRDVLSQLFPQEVVQREIEDFIREIADLRLRTVAEQETQLQRQQQLVQEAIAAVGAQASGFENELAATFLRIQSMSGLASEKMKKDFTSALEALRQLQLAIAQAQIAAATAAPVAPSAGNEGQFFSPPSFQTGARFVPFDMVARLHQGERVLPPGQAGGFSMSGGAPNVTFNISIQGGQVRTALDARRFVRDEVLPELQKIL